VIFTCDMLPPFSVLREADGILQEESRSLYRGPLESTQRTGFS
jgi:hypothetical protein